MEYPTKNTQCVILLHGLGRTARSMHKIAKTLKNQHYQVINISYPSRRYCIEQLIATVVTATQLQQLQTKYSKIHFVTHSLGGILVRQLLQSHSLPTGSRIVMLCPPNHGSEIVDRYQNSKWYQWITGPAGQQLGTIDNQLLIQLKPIAYDVGIITGNRSYDPWFSNLFDGPNDGKVSVDSAKLTEMSDFSEMNVGHSMIMNHPLVIQQVIKFIASARFH